MKKLVLIVLIAAVFASCKKENDTQGTPAQQQVSFAASMIELPGTKDWPCSPDTSGNFPEPDYAQVTLMIDSIQVDFFPLVYRIDGQIFTQNITLSIPPSGEYTLTNFLLWNDAGTTEEILPGADDSILMGTPSDTSTYASYILKPVAFSFPVSGFSKAEVEVEVLCYLDDTFKDAPLYSKSMTKPNIQPTNKTSSLKLSK